MKILYLEWNSYANSYIKEAWKCKGHTLQIFSFPASENCKSNPELCNKLVLAIKDSQVDSVFSINFFPIVAIACKACNIKYISWTYDSPYSYLYSDTILFETNYAFVFDRHEANSLRGMGVNTVYHLPLAIPKDGYHALKPKVRVHDKYISDISMVGSMYSEKKHQLIQKFDNAPQFVKGYLDALINAQKYLYGIDVITDALIDNIVNELNKCAPLLNPDDELQSRAWMYSKYFLLREVTRLERFELLEKLSSHFQVSLYTHEPTPNLPNVVNRGRVDYINEAPLVMKNSKINLNISLRSIVSGIPLRAFDIIGAGGFLLTNYQEELQDYLIPDTDFVYFESPEDLIEKCKFYLSHDEVRQQIALNGLEKAFNYHTYDKRIEEIERIISE